MKINTVADLRRLLKESGTSPEEFAKKHQISNMTIRRLLKKPDHDRLSKKNILLLSSSPLDPESIALSGFDSSSEKLIQTISSDAMKGESTFGSVFTKVKQILNLIKKVPQFKELNEKIKFLIDRFSTFDQATKTIVIGSLLYFLNPADLITDAIIGIGYVDDLGVLSIVCHYIHNKKEES